MFLLKSECKCTTFTSHRAFGNSGNAICGLAALLLKQIT